MMSRQDPRLNIEARDAFLFPKAMDSQVTADGHLLDIVDDAWREEILPKDDILVPIAELPDPEADNGESHMTLKEQEQKWSDLSLGNLSKQHQSIPT